MTDPAEVIPAALATQENSLMPALAGSLSEIAENMKIFREFVRGQMVDKTDFMVIPGTGKNPTILKPGMEKLLYYHGFGCEFIRENDQCIRITTPGQAEIVEVYTVRIYDKRTDKTIVEGCSGECSSWEEKFRENWIYPDKMTPAQKELQPQMAYRKPGKFGPYPKTDAEILAQGNTIKKIAMKRAMAGGTLHATRASAFFTQDVEDMPEFQKESQPSAATGAPAIVMVSPKQWGLIKAECEKQGLTGKDLWAHSVAKFGKPHKVQNAQGTWCDNLTKQEASTLIGALKDKMVPSVVEAEATPKAAVPEQPALPAAEVVQTAPAPAAAAVSVPQQQEPQPQVIEQPPALTDDSDAVAQVMSGFAGQDESGFHG